MMLPKWEILFYSLSDLYKKDGYVSQEFLDTFDQAYKEYLTWKEEGNKN